MANYRMPIWERNAVKIIEAAGYITKDQLQWLRIEDKTHKGSAEKDIFRNFERAHRMVEVNGVFYPVKKVEYDSAKGREVVFPDYDLAGESKSVTQAIWFVLFTANFVRNKMGHVHLDLDGLHRYKADFFDFSYFINPSLRQPRIRLKYGADGLKRPVLEEVQSVEESLNMASHSFEVRAIGKYEGNFDNYIAEIYKRLLAEKDKERFIEAQEVLRGNLDYRKELNERIKENSNMKPRSVIIVDTPRDAALFYIDFYSKGPYKYVEYPLDFWQQKHNAEFVQISPQDLIQRVQVILNEEG